jgi:hypothetical protein
MYKIHNIFAISTIILLTTLTTYALGSDQRIKNLERVENFLEEDFGQETNAPESLDMPDMAISEEMGSTASPKKTIIYSGSQCIPVENSAKLNINERGQAFNMTTSSITVLCPIEKDYTNGLSFSIVVWAIDQNYSQDVSCKALYENPSTPDGSSAWVSTTGTKSTYQIIGTSLLVQPNNSNWSHWALLCKVPPTYNGIASGILTYRLDQYE